MNMLPERVEILLQVGIQFNLLKFSKKIFLN